MRRPAVVSAPAMFGRLPDQRDYVRWRVGAVAARVTTNIAAQPGTDRAAG